MSNGNSLMPSFIEVPSENLPYLGEKPDMMR